MSKEEKLDFFQTLALTKRERKKTKYDESKGIYIYPESFIKRVCEVGVSGVPKRYFVMHVLDKESQFYQNAQCFEGYAEVLRQLGLKHGFSFIEEVSVPILAWWRDVNMNGFCNIRYLVHQYKSEFIPLIKSLINDIYFFRGVPAEVNEDVARHWTMGVRFVDYDWINALFRELAELDDSLSPKERRDINYITCRLSRKDGMPLADCDYEVFESRVKSGADVYGS